MPTAQDRRLKRWGSQPRAVPMRGMLRVVVNGQVYDRPYSAKQLLWLAQSALAAAIETVRDELTGPEEG